jgi:hypothetical protein
MKSMIMVFVIISFIIPFSKAQVGFSDWEIDYFKINSTNVQKKFIDTVEFPRNLNFPKLKLKKFGFDEIYCWNIYLKKCFAAFFTESKSYAFDKAVTLVYGILSLGNYDTFSFQSQLKSSLNDTIWAENVYTSLIPVLKKGWNILDPETKNIYSEIILYTENYLKRFNYQSELLYQQKLQEQSKIENFTLYGCQATCKKEFRKAEAFIFRRINDSNSGKGNWTIQWISKMLSKLKAQLGIQKS